MKDQGPTANSQERSAARSKQSNQWRLLGILVLVLVVGFAGRYWLGLQDGQRVAQLTSEVDRAMSVGDWPAAEAAARDWATLRPEDPTPWQRAAEAAMALNQPELAAGYLIQMPDNAPLEAYLNLGFLQMEVLNDPQGTLETCQKTLQFYPDDSETHERLLFYYTMTCQRNEIAREAKRAIDAGSDTLATYAYLVAAKWMTFTNGTETNRRWLQAEPGNELFEVAAVLHLPSYPELYEIAKTVTPEGVEPRPIEYASDQVEALLGKYPNNVELLAVSLRNACRNGDADRVLEGLAKLDASTAEDNRFWRIKGWYHASQEQWDKAREAYERALQLEPFDWESQLELATLLRSQDGIEAAKPMQSRSDLGKKLTFAIMQAPVLQKLEPDTTYQLMLDYFRVCEQDALAERLGRLLTQ